MIPLQLLSTDPPAAPTLADLLSTLSSGFSVILTAVTSACSTIVSTRSEERRVGKECRL